MKNFKFLSKDVCLLKLSSNKGCDIDCFAMKIADTINCYYDYDKLDFMNIKQPFMNVNRLPSNITFCVYGDSTIKKIQNLFSDELFTLYCTNAVDFNEGTIDHKKFTCSNISYIKCHETKISCLNIIEKNDFCNDTCATFTVDFSWHEIICDPSYCGYSYDENEIFNKKDIVSIFNINRNNSNAKFNIVDEESEESYFNNVDENRIVEEITNDMQKCFDKEITEKMNKVFEDTANSLLISNLMLM